MIARRFGRALCALLVAAGIVFGGLLIAPSVMGWERYVIVSGSMTGTYDRGSLVFDEVVPVKSLKVGDVITYRPPRGAGPTGLVTHRISKIGRDPKTGEPVFRTKGDANSARRASWPGSPTRAGRSPASPSARCGCSSSGSPLR
jgi:signal peptidase